MIAPLQNSLTRRKAGTWLLLCSSFLGASHTYAIGTDAGVNIANTATVSFSVNGAMQTPVDSNTVQVVVDELLDVVVVDDNGGPVAVGAAQSGAILQFSITNNGNGSEIYRIIADSSVNEGGFDPLLNQLYLESNGLPGLQIGSDTPYVSGSGDPVIAEDETLVLYVQADIPPGLSQGDNGDIEVRAVAQTILDANAGLDDPDDPAWPVPGTSYATAGDGGGDAVVGTSADISNLLLRNAGRYQISEAVVSIAKNAVSVADPFGGSTIVPGSVITYELIVRVIGSGTAEALTVADVIPVELEYQANTLTVSGATEDDDFAPSGTDNSGFDAANTTLLIDTGDVAGGTADIVISFDAAIR